MVDGNPYSSHDGSGKPKESPLYHDHGNIYLYTIAGTTLTRITQAPIGGWSQGVTFSSDGRTLAVTNMIEKDLTFLTFDGKTLKETGPHMKMPGGPVAIRTAEK
jgi:Tol biopolymer transport system component